MKPGVDFTAIAVSFFCHDGNGRLLLQKRGPGSRGHHGTWEEGGGMLEFGEQAVEAALRELKEEYGCSGTVESQWPVYSFLEEEQGKKSHWMCIPFVIRVKPEEVRQDTDEFVSEVGWFTLDQLPMPRSPGFQYALDLNRASLEKLLS